MSERVRSAGECKCGTDTSAGECECGRGVSARGCEWEGWKCRRVRV